MRLRKTKLVKKVCYKCRQEYASFHHSTKYCEDCYQRYFSYKTQNLKKLDKEIKFIEEAAEEYQRDVPKYVYGNDDEILGAISKNGKIQSVDYTVEEKHPIPQPKKVIIVDDVDEFDKDYYELLKRIDNIKYPY